LGEGCCVEVGVDAEGLYEGAGSFRGPAALASASAIVRVYTSVQSSMRDLSAQSVEVELDLLLCGAPCCQTKHHSSITSPRLSAPIELHRAFCGETRKIPETPSPRLLTSPISSRPSAARRTSCIPLSKLIARVNTTAGFLPIRSVTVFYPSSSHVPLPVHGCFRSCTQQPTAIQSHFPMLTAFLNLISLATLSSAFVVP
jgi:hypothetical protein